MRLLVKIFLLKEMVFKLLKNLLKLSVFSHLKCKNIYSCELLSHIHLFKEYELISTLPQLSVQVLKTRFKFIYKKTS